MNNAQSPATLRAPTTEFDNLTAYINAGGRGTRLEELFFPGEKGIAKALLEIGNPPIKLIDMQIEHLLDVGCTDIVVGCGDQTAVADHVAAVYPDTVVPATSKQQYGTAGDLLDFIRRAHKPLNENIMVSCCDVVLDVNELEFWRTHLDNGSSAITIALTTATNVPNYGAFHVARDGKVVFCGEGKNEEGFTTEAPDIYYRGSSTGAFIINRGVLESYPWTEDDGQLSFYRDVIPTFVGAGALYAYNNGERYFRDIGTVKDWNEFSEELSISQSFPNRKSA